MSKLIQRCAWANVNDPLMQKYHDYEWGRPLHNNQKLFELLSLEIMQAGLSWRTVLHKRVAFEQVFYHFNYQKVMKMAPEVPKLMTNDKIIRNRLKLQAIINNARIIDQLNQKGVSLNHYLWRFVNFKSVIHHYRTYTEVPTKTGLSSRISRVMKRDGFKFTGPVTIYSFMEASGMVNDHTMNCFLRS